MRRDDGFSLLEVLVATALTLTVVGLTAQAYLGALNANEAVQLMAGTNQNLQSGTSFISQDLMKAGQNIPLGGIIVPGGANSVAVNAPGPGARPLGGEGGRLPPIVLGNAAGPLVGDDEEAQDGARTDVITVAYLDDGYPTLRFTGMAADATSGTVFYDPDLPPRQRGTQIDRGAFKVQPGDLFMLQQSGSIVHEVTATPTEDNPQLMEFRSDTDVTGFNQPNAASGGLVTFRENGAVIPASVTARRLKVVTYFIDKSNRAHPRLMRQENGRAPEPIALDVENLQITYDFFVQGSPFRNEPALTGGLKVSDIRKINVYLAARSDEKLRQQQRFLRNSVLTQVTVRSLGLIDQYR